MKKSMTGAFALSHVLALAAAAALLAGSATADLTSATLVPTGHRHKMKWVPALLRPAVNGSPQFGDPLPGLNAAQMAAFEGGREEFESVETPEGGLGPIFNNSSCAACHSAGATGGASAIMVTRFGRRLADGSFDPLTAKGGTLLHEFAIDPAAREFVPAEANVVAKRITTPLFGAGLIEAIPDATITLNALLPFKPDGIKGRAAIITDVVSGQQRVGHFGWKAQHASLLGFAADAYLNEMGVTSRFFPKDVAPNGNQALLALYDKVPDIEDAPDPITGKSDIDKSSDFIILLGPPPPLRLTASAVQGSALFLQMNCGTCHTPVMFTGASKIAALFFKPVPLYSDLLLHDMGSLGDGIVQGPAGAREMKTAPLWGLRARGPFLHDGRAKTVGDAIHRHDGEAAASRARYDKLNAAQKQQLLDFLMSI